PADDVALHGKRRRPRPRVIADSVQRLGAQVEVLQHHIRTPGPVVISLRNEDVESILAGMPAWAMTAVVAQRDRFHQRRVHADPAGDRGCDLSHLKGMGQPGALVISRKDNDLGLAGKTSEGRGMHDSIAVTLETGALVVGLLCDGAIARSFGKRRARPQRHTLVLLAEFPVHDGSRPWVGLRTC